MVLCVSALFSFTELISAPGCAVFQGLHVSAHATPSARTLLLPPLLSHVKPSLAPRLHPPSMPDRFWAVSVLSLPLLWSRLNHTSFFRLPVSSTVTIFWLSYQIDNTIWSTTASYQSCSRTAGEAPPGGHPLPLGSGLCSISSPGSASLFQGRVDHHKLCNYTVVQQSQNPQGQPPRCPQPMFQGIMFSFLF